MVAFPAAGGVKEMLCLRLDLLNGWLFTIDESRVKDDETQQKVRTYQRECYRVLFEHFYAKTKVIDPAQETEEADAPRIRMVTEARHTFGIPAAAQLWIKLGLPVVPAMLHAPEFDLFAQERKRAA